MSAPRSTAKLVENLRQARLAARVTAPQARADQIADIRAAARMARDAAYGLTPFHADDTGDLAREVDDLATAVHMLAEAVLRLCDQVERPRP
jgi:hypothetical protein